MQKKIYDIIGIGIGPFNLGLAALCYCIPELHCLFVEQSECFSWHPGLLLDEARLQVPFYADLVTLADPQSPFSYMAFLKAMNRMFRFAIHENYFVTRKEYNQYCRWVAEQLPTLRFNQRCITINKVEDYYELRTQNETFYAKHIVLGTGTIPSMPGCVKDINHPMLFHSADYLYRRDKLLSRQSVTIIGSGQSAAEIFYDLLQHREHFKKGLHWFTRSERIFPMDYSKLSLEMSSPDYIDHFYSLNESTRKSSLEKQNILFKGVNINLIGEIYDKLYIQSLEEEQNPVSIHPDCELTHVTASGENITATFHHSGLDSSFTHETGVIILATGYKQNVPRFLDSLKKMIRYDKQGNFNAKRNYAVDENDTIFIQNAESPTHGFNASDLSLGPYRNAVIINSILGHERYKIERGITFQTFGCPSDCQ